MSLKPYFYHIMSCHKGSSRTLSRPFFSTTSVQSIHTTHNVTDKNTSAKKPTLLRKNLKKLGDKIFGFSTWTGSLVLIGCGTLVAVIIFTNLITELTSEDTPSHYFQASFKELQEHPRVVKLFGPDMSAHADPRSKRRRSRLPSYQLSFDSRGCQHLMMVYYLEGSSDRDVQGTVTLHMVDIQPQVWSSKEPHQPNWKYKLLSVDIPGGGLLSRRITVRGDETKLGGIW